MRRRARDDAARQVALRLAAVAAAEDELRRRQLKLQNCYDEQRRAAEKLNQSLNQGIEARRIVAHQTFLRDLRRAEEEIKASVEQQTAIVARAEKDLAAAREKLLEAAKELKSIEVHKEKWTSEEKISRERRDEKISDEIGAIIHGRQKRS